MIISETPFHRIISRDPVKEFITTEQTLPLMTNLESCNVEQNVALAHGTEIINFHLLVIRT